MTNRDETLAKSKREAERVFAVCDSRTGTVYHIHSVVMVDDAQPREERVVKAEALEFAKAGGEVKGPLTVVEIAPDELSIETDYKLNVKLGRLEPIRPSRPRKTTRKGKTRSSTTALRKPRSRPPKKR